MKKIMPFAFLFFAGCWTFDKSEYPAVALTSAPEGKDVTVEVAGFDASQTMYVPTYGMTTVVEPVAYGRCHRRVFWGTTTYATTTYLPQVATTAQFRDQAVQALERAGFLTRAPNAAYRVEVVFSGPFATDGETLEMLCWSVFSLFTAERGIQTWQAQLRIHDKATGRLLLEHRLSQQYTATAWGLIPFFSPAAAGTTEAWAMKAWCLSALTDRAVAEATAFLSRR